MRAINFLSIGDVLETLSTMQGAFSVFNVG